MAVSVESGSTPAPIVTADDGRLALDDLELPGIVERIEVTGELRTDSIRVASRSGATKLPRGWADAQLTVSVRLPTDTTSCYDKLAAFERAFKRSGDDARPLIYSLVNRHAQARGVTRVLFSELTSSDSNVDDTIVAQLAFVEWRPGVVRRERSVDAVLAARLRAVAAFGAGAADRIGLDDVAAGGVRLIDAVATGAAALSNAVVEAGQQSLLPQPEFTDSDDPGA